jgi:putative DNA primase/helicase
MIQLLYENGEVNGELRFDVAALDTDKDQVIYRQRINLADAKQRAGYAQKLSAAANAEGHLAPMISGLLQKHLDSITPGPVLTRMSSVTRQPIKWLWENRIARGKITVIAGDPGVGKSFLTIDLASRVSTGSPWPDDPIGILREPANVILLNAEDDAGDTIGPRLDHAGADSQRVFIMEGIRHCNAQGEPSIRSFTLDDMRNLSLMVDTAKPHLVVIDPVSAHLGDVDSHKNAEVRALLAPLSKLAAESGVAIVCVTHLSKAGGGPAMYRASGSLAFIAAARAGFAVAKDKNDPARRLFLPIKNNIGNDQDGLAYRIIDGKLSWEKDAVSTTADEAFGADCGGGDAYELDEAVDWLREALLSGPVDADATIKRAQRDGIAARTLDRAKKQLRVKAKKFGFGSSGKWRWCYDDQQPLSAPNSDDPDGVGVLS